MALEYKIGDKVRIKGTDIGGIIKEIKRGQYVVQISHSSQIMVAWPEDLSLIERHVEDETLILNGKEFITALGDIKLLTGKVEIWDLPEGYEFRDENGNVIEAKKIVLEKKKPKYPQTYEECCAIMGFGFKWDNPFCINKDTHPYIKNLDNLMEGLCKLRICRDAYWKIAGEEIGLGKSWEPDWNSLEPKYVISISKNSVKLIWEQYYHRVFAFPTKEMRDVFYENFKELIESVKELL